MKPFLTDRPRVHAPILLHTAGETSALGAVLNHAKGNSHGQSGGTGTSQVECVRQGDKITRLIVTCGCGERIELDCLYAGG